MKDGKKTRKKERKKESKKERKKERKKAFFKYSLPSVSGRRRGLS